MYFNVTVCDRCGEEWRSLSSGGDAHPAYVFKIKDNEIHLCEPCVDEIHEFATTYKKRIRK